MLRSIHGDVVQINKHGVKDREAGFYRHAELEINGRLVIGDVIHSETIQDYYKKQMHLDSSFNRAVLHIASQDAFTNLRIRLHNGKAVTTVISSDLVKDVWTF